MFEASFHAKVSCSKKGKVVFDGKGPEASIDPDKDVGDTSKADYKVAPGAANGQKPPGIFLDFFGFFKEGDFPFWDTFLKSSGSGFGLGSLAGNPGIGTAIGAGFGLLYGFVGEICDDEWVFVFRIRWKITCHKNKKGGYDPRVEKMTPDKKASNLVSSNSSDFYGKVGGK